MAKKQTPPGGAGAQDTMMPVVAATLTGVIYQARLLNRQSKVNIPDEEVIRDVVTLWRTVRESLESDSA
jgi:hypothetical protein